MITPLLKVLLSFLQTSAHFSKSSFFNTKNSELKSQYKILIWFPELSDFVICILYFSIFWLN